MATDYAALDQLLDQAIQKHISGGSSSGLTPEQIAAYYGTETPKTGVIKELGKAVGRGALGIPKLAVRAAQGGALDIGALLGYSPEQNAIAQTLGQAAESIQGVQQNPTLAPNAQFAEQHPVANFVGENIEGALPWIAGAAASKIPVIGPAVLPAAATLSAQAEGTERQMKRGVEGNQALAQATPGALAEGALFAAMPKVMGKLKGVPNAAIEEGFTKGLLPGTLGKPGGVLKGAVQGLAAEAPYLYGQGEVKQAIDVASNAMTPEEWKQQHTPEAIMHALGTSAVGGAGFGALGGIGQKRTVEAKREEYKNLHQPIVDDKTPVDLNEKPVVTQPAAQQPVYSNVPQTGTVPEQAFKSFIDTSVQNPNARYLPDIRVEAPLIEETPATGQISKPETTIEQPVADQFADMPEDLKAYISDFMTNPDTTVEASALSQIIGVPEEVLTAKRNEALGVGNKPTLATGNPEEDKVLAESLGAKYNGNQEGANGEMFPMFTDNVTKSTLMLKPGDDLSARLKEKRDLFAQVVESPEGKQIPLAEATKRAKELVGAATPETEAKYQEKKGNRGYKNTKLARNILAKIHKDGFITTDKLENLKSGVSDLEDVPKKGGAVRTDRIQDYLEDTEGVLDKAVKDGVLRKEKGGFSYGLAKNKTPEDLQTWYDENIKVLGNKRVNAAEGVIESEKPTVEQNVVGDTDRFPTKADNARIDKAAAAREEVTARAQRPHTIFKERMDAFDRELKRIDAEIAKLPKDAKKNILRRDFTKAKARFKELIKEQNFDKLKTEANEYYDKIEKQAKAEYTRLVMSPKELRKIFGKQPEDVSREEIEKYIKKRNPELKQLKTIIDDLKSQARDIGRLELGERLNDFREGVEEGKKVKDITGIEKVESAENQRLREEQESIKTKEETLAHAEDMKFLDEMSKKGLSDEDRIDNADEILGMAREYNKDIDKAYVKQKSNKQKSLFLKKAAYDTWNKKNIALHTRQLAAIENPKSPTTKREVSEVKTTKELEREQNPKLKADYEKQQENIKLLKEKKEAATQRQIERLQKERKGLETKEQAQARREKEARERLDLKLKKESKEKAVQEEKKELAKKIQNTPEKEAGFEVKFNKKGEPISKADKEYTKFASSKNRVGASSAVPEAATKFVSHLADKFDLDKTFIVTESDLKNSNIKDVSITAKEIYDENGSYVGVLHSTTDGIDFLALNDSKIGNEKTLINTLSHEVGHAIINKHFESASAETKQAIQSDFNSWLDKLSEKDSKAINELYQESGKTWEDFKQDYADMIAEDMSTGEFDINAEGVFHEYLAEQIAKYIKVTESAPKGILARFFNTLADKIRYIMRFANREFARNHAPIQSVAKWLNGLKTQNVITVKKNASLKKKTMVTYDDFKRVAKQVHNTFNPANNESVVKGMTDLVDASLADRGVVKQAYKGIFRLPWWVAEVRPAAENYEKSLESNVMLKQFLKATTRFDENAPGVISLKEIENKYNQLSKTSRELINKLLVEGDKEGTEWSTPKYLKSETLRNISKEDFEVYRQVRNFVNQAWNRDLQIQSDTLAYGLTKNIELQDKLGIAIRSQEIDTPNKLKDFLESQPSIKAKGGLDTLITPQEFNIIADAIYSKDGIKDFYKEYSHNYRTESLPGYIPRERLDGAEWVVELHTKEGTKIFNQGFYTKAEAQRVFDDLKKNPEKYAPHNIKNLKVFSGKYPTESSEYFSGESLLKEPVLRPVTSFERFSTGEDKLIADNVAKVLDKFENVPNKAEVVDAVRKEIMKHILAQRGMQNRVARSEQLIEGYNEDSPLDAIQTSLDRSAYRQAKMRYIIDQSRLISKTTDVQHKNAIREYVNRTLEPAVTGSKQVQMFKNLAAVYFMGFRPLTALMQLAQLHTVGAAELGMHLKSLGIGGSAQKLLAQAELDMRTNKISDIEKAIIKMAEERGVTWETSSQSFMFKDVDAITSKHFLGKRIVKLTDIALSMFQYMEKHNRQSAILAAYRVFSKGSDVFSQEAFDKAMEYNNNTNFMMNKGNVPYWAMRNPVGMSAYTLMSYTLNMANWMLNRSHGSLSDVHIDKWTQRQAFLKMLGYTAVLAGVSGAPFADDLNKLIRKIFGRDLHLETKAFIKKHANEDIANLVADGVFAPLGVNVSSNVAVRVPFLSGLLDDNTIGESVSGAAGALVKKGGDAVYAAFTGQGRKFVEAASPEVIAGALRAERLYREGQRGPSGKPVYFEGKPVKSTGSEALMQGLFGIKSERRANIMEVSNAEYKLTQYWNDKKKIAESKARRGDLSALQDFNRQLIKDKNARMLVKPIKLETSKANKDKTAFELSQ